MPQAHLLLEFQVVSPHDPTVLGPPHELLELGLRRQVPQLVLGGFGSAARPFGQQPQFRVGLRPPVVPMRRPDPHRHQARWQLLVGSLRQLARRKAFLPSPIPSSRILKPGGDSGCAAAAWVGGPCGREAWPAAAPSPDPTRCSCSARPPPRASPTRSGFRESACPSGSRHRPTPPPGGKSEASAGRI